MSIPAVTCGSKIVYAYGAGGGSETASLSATATGSPYAWEWRILAVPSGQESLYYGVHGDFNNGTAAIQNPQLSGISTAISGTIVVQARARNSSGGETSGWSDPTIDKQAGQQEITVLTQSLGLPLPGDYQYDWGQAMLDGTLRGLESATASAIHSNGLFEISALTEKVPVNTDVIMYEDGTTGAKKKALISEFASGGDVVHKTGDETIAGVKTFTSSPSLPTPSVSGDAANKGYVDNQISAVSGEYGAPVADIAALRAVGSALRMDRQLRLCESKGALYRFDTSGTGSDDGDGVIVPSDITPPTPGRWFKVQAATQDHEALSDLLGGAANDHQHLTTSQVNKLTGIETGADVTANHAPKAHAASHQSSGSDEVATTTAGVGAIPKAGASGKLDIGWVPTGSSSSTVCIGNDSRLSDARAPTTHATTHKSGGGDAIKLDELSAPTDVTTLNASSTAHGLLPRLENSSTKFLRDDGTWQPASGAGCDTTAIHNNVAGEIDALTNKATLVLTDEFIIEDSAFSYAKKKAAVSAIPVATTSNAGFESSADKTKLDGIESGADVTANHQPQAHATSHKSGGSDAIKLDELAAPTDVTTLDASGATHGLLPRLANTVTKFLRDDGTWQYKNSDGMGVCDIPIVLQQNTNSPNDVVLGAFSFDAADYPYTAIKFKATGYVTAGTLTGTIKLYNVTDNSTLVTLGTFTGLSYAEQISAALSMSVGKKVYEVRANVTGGGGLTSQDLIVCSWAGLQIR